MINNPSNHDVYFARGNGVEAYPGNKYYRECISETYQTYQATNSSDTKNRITNDIISTIACRGGRFFYRPVGVQAFHWREVPRSLLYKKVMQSLRDCKPSSTRTISNSVIRGASNLNHHPIPHTAAAATAVTSTINTSEESYNNRLLAHIWDNWENLSKEERSIIVKKYGFKGIGHLEEEAQTGWLKLNT
mmetsp:Transcript_19769/g.24386  ORF Transcript_19769/g.24386 Transcript_19769/m.24386 type:complete len:190 (+) Transcript_19769:123-692(+)